ncbi:hypothetical protein EC957_003436 [Mortierella hygrophila]|uniref:Uncharacterized protein n=1 Tax=Mortierella hygrophila TaxID=979708 RepID=A0A9P6F3F3_9FUNG|nr:hypothetical protein EC957_003436 [Mortierella hygrophila]
MSFNRNIPLVIAAGVGVMSGFYIWEPMFKKYQRESKGTWQYEVVQQTRAEEMNRHADAVVANANAAAAASTSTSTPGSTSPVVPPVPAQAAPAPVDTTVPVTPSAAETKYA